MQIHAYACSQHTYNVHHDMHMHIIHLNACPLVEMSANTNKQTLYTG